ncbi:MAG: hypothetical protein L0332_28420 [Chloroflexi bacterium]|nr:hypothetical protein [Chloroflexota bacterium]MCI0576222.1 hypothetical protein [Chloroflexota bacterium]MCI0645484.1 hypothetical protein [Chloroflexota bacterium]MCI0730623.1 hypothetical protein [Chloroflexota bacterium]
MTATRPLSRTWHYGLLWLLALLSLLFNAVLIITLLSLRAQAREEVNQAIEILNEATLENFDLPVHVDETLAISMTVPYSDTFVVPISATVPVSTSVLFKDNIQVPIDTIIPVNTTVHVPVDIPVAGRVTIPIPIFTNIPVSLTVEVPISRTIPVRTDIPVDLMVTIPVQSEIPIQTDVPVLLDFPVTIPLSELGFQALVEQLQEALAAMAEMLGGPPPAPAPAPGS